MIKKLWIHMDYEDGHSIFYNFTSRKEAIDFIESFEDDEDEMSIAHNDAEAELSAELGAEHSQENGLSIKE